MLKVPISEKRLEILEWLKDPAAHFPPDRHGDLVEDGVLVDAALEQQLVDLGVDVAHTLVDALLVDVR
ncbi:ArsR family transcriptional regulator, partial [Streptomyces avermitilis]